MSGADKDVLFAKAKIFVLPSYSENFGNVVLEAMVRRCPVVVTSEVGAANIVTAASGGQVVNGESETLSRTINTLLQNTAELSAMGEAGRKYIIENYSWEKVAHKMTDVYENVLSHHSVMNHA